MQRPIEKTSFPEFIFELDRTVFTHGVACMGLTNKIYTVLHIIVKPLIDLSSITGPWATGTLLTHTNFF